jgi:hypothetical protein
MINTVFALHHIIPIPLILQGEDRIPYLVKNFSTRIGFANFEMDCLEPCAVFKIPVEKRNDFKKHYKFSEFIQTSNLGYQVVIYLFF